jgi:hypothetical protein
MRVYVLRFLTNIIVSCASSIGRKSWPVEGKLGFAQDAESAIERKHEVYDRICGRAQSAATPKQTVKLLI